MRSNIKRFRRRKKAVDRREPASPDSAGFRCARFSRREVLFPLVPSVRKGLFGRTEIGGKLLVQAHLNPAIVLCNLVHLELVGGHLAKSIAQCFNSLQQLLPVALQRDIQVECWRRTSWQTRSPKRRVAVDIGDRPPALVFCHHNLNTRQSTAEDCSQEFASLI